LSRLNTKDESGKVSQWGVIVVTCSIGWIMIGGSQLNIYTEKIVGGQLLESDGHDACKIQRIEGRSQTRLLLFFFFFFFLFIYDAEFKEILKKKEKKILKKC
jgi:hypothetical protein